MVQCPQRCGYGCPYGTDIWQDSGIVELCIRPYRRQSVYYRRQSPHAIPPVPLYWRRQVLEAGPVMARVIETLCRNSILSRIFSKISRKIPVPGIRRHAFGFPGYGLQFEIEAATRAIRTGKPKSPPRPCRKASRRSGLLRKSARCRPDARILPGA